MADPRVLLILEWDDVRSRETDRARRMLRRVRAQIADIGLGPALPDVDASQPGLARRLHAR